MNLYVIGLHNPQSMHPRHAFYPHDAKAIGYQLWELASEAMPELSMTEWLDGTDRANLLCDVVLSPDYRSAARRRGIWIRQWIEQRWVLIVGANVAAAIGHTASPLCMGGPTGRWMLIPSLTRNAFYKDADNRARAGRMIAILWELCDAGLIPAT